MKIKGLLFSAGAIASNLNVSSPMITQSNVTSCQNLHANKTFLSTKVVFDAKNITILPKKKLCSKAINTRKNQIEKMTIIFYFPLILPLIMEFTNYLNNHQHYPRIYVYLTLSHFLG